jgi:xylan 1,4-beta-xylosidase
MCLCCHRPLSILCLWLFVIVSGLLSITTAQTGVAFSSFQYEGVVRLLDAHRLQPGEFLNPILPGMYPDPSIVRVGSDFYLVTSSFVWYPSIPIFHSDDLVHWKQIGFVLDRPGQIDLNHAQVSEGIFAPTIRYHDGVFYVITTLMGGFHSFYVTARNPAGPWSDPIRLPELEGIDPSFFFDDDGRAYIVHNGPPPNGRYLYGEHRAIWLVPFDIESGKISGPQRMLADGSADLQRRLRWIEGPHLYHRNGYYYLVAAEGGTSTDHCEMVFRSTSLDGPFIPYAENPILTQRTLDPNRADPIANTGHADLVEAPDGAWWAVFLGVRPYRQGFFNTGRETYLLPVAWKDDWPVILPPGVEVPHVLKAPKIGTQTVVMSRPLSSFAWDDNFKEKELKMEWQTLRTPPKRCWNLEAGQLILEPGHDDLTSRGNPCFLARRQQHADFTASITLQLRDAVEASDAGLVLFQNEHSFFFLGVKMHSASRPEIFIEQGTGTLSKPAGVIIDRKELPSGAGKIVLKIAEAGPKLSFSYRLNGMKWQGLGRDADATLLSTSKAGGFVGCFVGPFARLAKE